MSRLEHVAEGLTQLGADADQAAARLADLAGQIERLSHEATSVLQGARVSASGLLNALRAAKQSCQRAADHLPRVGRCARAWSRLHAAGSAADRAAAPPAEALPDGVVPLELDELQLVARRHTGGGEFHPTLRGSAGNPIFVPRRDPTPMLKALQARVAARIGDVGGDQSAVDRIKRGWRNTARTVAELQDVAMRASDDFRELVVSAAQQVPTGSACFGPSDKHMVKGHERLAEKVQEEVRELRAGKPALDQASATAQAVSQSIGDALRATILVDTPEQVREAVDALRRQARASGSSIVVENKWTRREDDAYHAVHAALWLKGPGGARVEAEVQFHPRALLGPKEANHPIYDVIRGSDAEDAVSDMATYRLASKLIWLAGLCRLEGEP